MRDFRLLIALKDTEGRWGLEDWVDNVNDSFDLDVQVEQVSNLFVGRITVDDLVDDSVCLNKESYGVDVIDFIQEVGVDFYNQVCTFILFQTVPHWD